jgi:hypothetical protein
MLKMNLKASGTNHSTSNGQISAVMGNILVLGADVTHPGTDSVPDPPVVDCCYCGLCGCECRSIPRVDETPESSTQRGIYRLIASELR